jgi:hypothetical protein
VRNTILTLPTNSTNLIGRLFFLVVTFFLAYLFINFGLKEPNTGHVIFQIKALHFHLKVIHFLYFLIAVIGFLALIIVASLLSINKVQIDTTADTIIFSGLLTKRTVAINDISEYFETVHRNRFKVFYGLLLKINGDRTIQVAGQNVKSLSHLKDYLNDRKINCVGQKKMRFPFN